MRVLALGLLSASAFAAVGFVGAGSVARNPGPDYTGIALLITAIAGLIATVSGLIIGLRKQKATDAVDTEVLLRLAARGIAAEEAELRARERFKEDDDRPT